MLFLLVSRLHPFFHRCKRYDDNYCSYNAKENTNEFETGSLVREKSHQWLGSTCGNQCAHYGEGHPEAGKGGTLVGVKCHGGGEGGIRYVHNSKHGVEQ